MIKDEKEHAHTHRSGVGEVIARTRQSSKQNVKIFHSKIGTVLNGNFYRFRSKLITLSGFCTTGIYCHRMIFTSTMLSICKGFVAARAFCQLITASHCQICKRNCGTIQLIPWIDVSGDRIDWTVLVYGDFSSCLLNTVIHWICGQTMVYASRCANYNPCTNTINKSKVCVGAFARRGREIDLELCVCLFVSSSSLIYRLAVALVPFDNSRWCHCLLFWLICIF